MSEQPDHDPKQEEKPLHEQSAMRAQKGKQGSKDDDRLFDLMKQLFFFLATIVVSCGAYLWSERYSLPTEDAVVVAVLFVTLFFTAARLLNALLDMT